MNHHANAFKIRIWQWGLLAAIFVFWWAMTKPGLIPPFFFSNDSQAAFFFGGSRTGLSVAKSTVISR